MFCLLCSSAVSAVIVVSVGRVLALKLCAIGTEYIALSEMASDELYACTESHADCDVAGCGVCTVRLAVETVFGVCLELTLEVSVNSALNNVVCLSRNESVFRAERAEFGIGDVSDVWSAAIVTALISSVVVGVLVAVDAPTLGFVCSFVGSGLSVTDGESADVGGCMAVVACRVWGVNVAIDNV